MACWCMESSFSFILSVSAACATLAASFFGLAKKPFNSSRKIFSRSAIGILLLHFRQRYFGESWRAYILPPQPHHASRLKVCVGRRPGFFHVLLCSSRIWFTCVQRASETMGAHSICPHSDSGFGEVFHEPNHFIRLK